MKIISFNKVKTFFNNLSLPLFIFIFSLIILNTFIVLNIYKQKCIEDNSFRLHVVANSNTTNDLIEKLKISEKITEYINSLELGSTKEKTIDTIQKNLQNILQVANRNLKDDSVNYTAYAKIGKISYDEKINTYVTMPKGNYDSLQIILGEGKGSNFWSLIFPSKKNIQNLEPLESILPGISKIYGDDNINQTIDNSNINIYEDNSVSNNEDSDNYSFKILEVFDAIKNQLSN
jgi:stage II sporulation protein R